MIASCLIILRLAAQTNKPVPADSNIAKKSAAADKKIAAVVDGEPIYEKDVLAGIPKRTFAGIDEETRAMKLERLIGEAKTRHFLKAQKVEVSAEDVNKELEGYRKNPPPMSCGCCRYASLEQFFQATNFTLEEFRESIRLQKGMDVYFERLWNEKYPQKEALNQLSMSRFPDYSGKYYKLYQIIFVIKPGGNPDRQQLDASEKAKKAYERLQKGEAFETVAKEMSDDKVVAEKGGYAGLVRIDEAWPEMQRIEVGAYSKPIEMAFGFMIVKKLSITQDDVTELLKDEFISQKYNEAYASMEKLAVKKM
jgi:hypothetical protein